MGVEAASKTPCGRAPSNRFHGEGTPASVGSSGYGWLATSFKSGGHYRGMYLNFYTTALYPINADARAYGFQLRCLSE